MPVQKPKSPVIDDEDEAPTAEPAPPSSTGNPVQRYAVRNAATRQVILITAQGAVADDGYAEARAGLAGIQAQSPEKKFEIVEWFPV